MKMQVVFKIFLNILFLNSYKKYIVIDNHIKYVFLCFYKFCMNFLRAAAENDIPREARGGGMPFP